MCAFFTQSTNFCLLWTKHICNSKRNFNLLVTQIFICFLHLFKNIEICDCFSDLKTRQDRDFINEYLEKGKKQDISNWNLANQEGNENIKMYEIENLAWILLRWFSFKFVNWSKMVGLQWKKRPSKVRFGKYSVLYKEYYF